MVKRVGAVAGQAVRKVVSRKAFAATWCASMRPAVTMAMRVSVRFTSEPRSHGIEATGSVQTHTQSA